MSLYDIVSYNIALMRCVYYLKDEGLFLQCHYCLYSRGIPGSYSSKIRLPLPLSSSSHVTEEIYCNIFKYNFCFALVLQLGCRGGRAMFDNAFILFILGLSQLE